jgi:glucokinase
MQWAFGDGRKKSGMNTALSEGLTVGVDLGGTKIAVGVVDPKGEIVSHVRIPTPSDPDVIVTAITGAVTDACRGCGEAKAIGIGAAGYVDEHRSTVRFGPNIRWRDKPIRALVEQATGLPAVVENDANAAAWGEFVHGAGAGCDDMVMVTLGTGLGAGIVSGGQLFRGRFGMAGEIGHYRAVPGGLPCRCGQSGCMEQYASGTAHARRARERAAADPERAGGLLALGDGTPGGIRDSHVAKAAEAGDPFALELFEETGRWVGQVLADLASILDPAVFVIGGGLSQTRELIRQPTERAYRQALGAGQHRACAAVVTATVGEHAGLIGAAELARSGLPADNRSQTSTRKVNTPWANCSSSGTGKPNGPCPGSTPATPTCPSPRTARIRLAPSGPCSRSIRSRWH